MKQIILPLAILAVVVAGCGSDSADTTTTTQADTTTTTTEAAATSTTVADTTTTTVADTTTTTAAASIPTTPYLPGEDATADELYDLYAVVFDSATTYDAKAPLIVDPSGLESTVDAYMAAGDGVGGIFLDVTATGTAGDIAAVVYDLQFAGNPFQTDQLGPAVLIDGMWKVTRDYFCEVLTLARVSCS